MLARLASELERAERGVVVEDWEPALEGWRECERPLGGASWVVLVAVG